MKDIILTHLKENPEIRSSVNDSSDDNMLTVRNPKSKSRTIQSDDEDGDDENDVTEKDAYAYHTDPIPTIAAPAPATIAAPAPVTIAAPAPITIATPAPVTIAAPVILPAQMCGLSGVNSGIKSVQVGTVSKLDKHIFVDGMLYSLKNTRVSSPRGDTENRTDLKKNRPNTHMYLWKQNC